MNKIICIVLIIIGLSSCSEQPKYIEGKSENSYGYDIVYFRDKRTGLCFAERGARKSYSFTCVPCDSLKKLIFY